MMLSNFAKQGLDPLGGTPAQFASFINQEIERWAAVILSMGSMQKK
jgi:tripartite-type tricarboxylate transporter receptor subunit TctC